MRVTESSINRERKVDKNYLETQTVGFTRRESGKRVMV